MKELADISHILNKPCLICGRRNIEHMVFYNPSMKYWQKHVVRNDVTDDCVPGSDHYACIDNLEYLEYLNARRSNI